MLKPLNAVSALNINQRCYSTVGVVYSKNKKIMLLYYKALLLFFKTPLRSQPLPFNQCMGQVSFNKMDQKRKACILQTYTLLLANNQIPINKLNILKYLRFRILKSRLAASHLLETANRNKLALQKFPNKIWRNPVPHSTHPNYSRTGAADCTGISTINSLTKTAILFLKKKNWNNKFFFKKFNTKYTVGVLRDNIPADTYMDTGPLSKTRYLSLLTQTYTGLGDRNYKCDFRNYDELSSCINMSKLNNINWWNFRTYNWLITN